MSTVRPAPLARERAVDAPAPPRPRQLWTLPGGIHPPEEKALSNGTPIRDAGLPEVLVLPLRQHAGAAAQPCVEVGAAVLAGQMLAEPDGFVSAGVHAPTSGTVRAIEERPIPHPSGLPDVCIVLEPDGADRWIDLDPVPDWIDHAPAELVGRIRDAGIAGVGGAGFPTAVKLAGGHDGRLQTLILNGIECEPYITADDVLMRHRAAEIVTGARMLMHVAGTREGLIAVEDNKPEAITALEHAVRAAGNARLEVVVVPTRYPSGGEKQLIQILTGREVRTGGLPADLGILCQNVGTAVAVQRALELGEPLVSRVTTVTGRAVGAPGNFDVRLGTPFSHLLRLAELDEAALGRLVMGGSMMGVAMADAAVPVVKTTNCILAATRAEFPPPAPEQPCIRCGMCEVACPAGLLPQQLYWYARAQDLDAAREHDIADCIECGACAWVCPSAIPLVQYYRHTKGAIRHQDADARRAERSRERFEHHQARIEAEKAEREAKKAARAEAARKKAAAARAAAADGGSASTTARDPKKAARAAMVEAALARAGDPRIGEGPADRATTYLGPEHDVEQQEPPALAKARSNDPAQKAEALAARIEQTRALLDDARAEDDRVRAGKLEAKIRGMETKLDAQRALSGASTSATVETGPSVRAPRAAGAAERRKDPAAHAQALAARIEQARVELDTVRAEGDGVRAGKLEAKIRGMETKLEALREAAGARADQTRSEAEARLEDRIERVRADVQAAAAEGDEEAKARLASKLAQMEQRLVDLATAGDEAAPKAP
ncbi:MAG: electron transport complex subunit RsxC [Pseudomonadales bacterium]|jgi:electron transport complex protein RnfC|nr:electron transport complex subunit RsxC [Pseudomonadales bacterium]